MAAETGPEMVAEIAADATIDEMMRRDPRTVSDEDFDRLIQAQRAARARFIQETEKKRMKRQGVEDE
jgi:hypothetical protein